MANRFWVGGSQSWNATAGTKWSTTSGGASGAATPTSADDVFLDANSTGTCTIAAGNTGAKSINMTGYAGTLAGGASITISGSVTLGGTITFAFAAFVFAASASFTSNGVTFTGHISINNPFTLTLADSLNCTGQVNLGNTTTLNLNNFNHTIATFNNGGGIGTLQMGSGTMTVTGGFTACGTITPSTSLLKLTGANVAFNAGGKTYNNVWLSGGGSGIFIDGGLTCNDLRIDQISGTIVTVRNGATITASSLTGWSGIAGNLMTYVSLGGAGTTWNLVVASGTISKDYMDLQGSAASGGATFYAGANSVDTGDNTGWTFTAAPSTLVYVQDDDAAPRVAIRRRARARLVPL